MRGREAASVVDSVASLIDGFDPALTGARDAMELVSEFSRLEHLASAGVALAARRVAQTDLWKRGGHRSAAHWLDHVTGMGVGDAVRIVAAAAKESEAARAERHRKARRVSHGVDADGMGWGSWRLPIAEHTRIVAQLDGEKAKLFTESRASGDRELVGAYAADALVRVFDRAGRRGAVNRSPHPDSAHPDTSHGETNVVGPTDDDATGDGVRSPGGSDRTGTDTAPGPASEVVEDWSFVKTVVRVDLTALDRGRVEPGEVCEVAGKGPIPVADVWRMIDGDAFVAAVTTKGTEIDKVVHLGRQPTVLQKTALEWFSAGECSIEGCTNPARIEIDHVDDWAHTNITRLPDLASPCGHHHDLKTYEGYTFGPRLPTGKRRLIPPDQSPPGTDGASRINGRPVATGPPELTLHHGDPPETAPGPGGKSTDTTQGDLFDTG